MELSNIMLELNSKLNQCNTIKVEVKRFYGHRNINIGIETATKFLMESTEYYINEGYELYNKPELQIIKDITYMAPDETNAGRGQYLTEYVTKNKNDNLQQQYTINDENTLQIMKKLIRQGDKEKRDIFICTVSQQLIKRHIHNLILVE